MKGDFSRDTFDATKHYSGVLMQQGRVQLDADWNEQVAITEHRIETEAADVIGASGTPKGDPGFAITASSGALHIGHGRYYVDGLLCTNESDIDYGAQPYLPNASNPADDFDTGTTYGLVYLHVWKRHITALNDPYIREKALGGPDTTTRIQIAWQVRVLPLPSAVPDASGDPECGDAFPEWNDLIAPPTGTMNARTVETTTVDECKLPPSAGYLRLENQLYRVEVHEGGPRSSATFKWSRDNGSIVAAVAKVDGKDLTVGELGKDDLTSFASGNWVELIDDEMELTDGHGVLLEVDTVEPNTGIVTVKTDPPTVDMDLHPRLRRWDHTGDASDVADGIDMTGDWIDLEDGVQALFSDNTFRAGDYWLIPARTATGEIEWPPFEVPNTAPEAQPPRGVRHHYARLALVKIEDGQFSLVDDCRNLFPPLTKICAEDICFDNGTCDFDGAETVQEALDRLCAANDLRFHNKHLHGWGIVCGLQVSCGPRTQNGVRSGVRVSPGYALDCEGNDIRLGTTQTVDILTMLKGLEGLGNTPVLDDKGNGEVCLRLGDAKGKKGGFVLERYVPEKGGLGDLFKGSLLMDVYEDCIKRLVDALQEEFDVSDESQQKLVSPARRKLSTMLNLLVQFWNPTDGRFVFLSKKEHDILETFYWKLRELLQSRTFCAMFDNARPFPQYPQFTTPVPSTIFTKGLHDRLRVHPSGKTAYSIGTGNRIYVYDLAKEEMIEEVEFPAGKDADVTDIAFSSDGNEIYATAIVDANDTIFAAARISGAGHKWGPVTIICGVHITTMVASRRSKNTLYAVGLGKGLFQINPENIDAKPSARVPFNAAGHLVLLDDQEIAYASDRGDDTSTGETFRRVLQLDLREDQIKSTPFTLQAQQEPLSGRDDIAATANRLFVVTMPPKGKTTKHLLVINTASNTTQGQLVDLGDDTEMRLAHMLGSNFLTISYEDSFRLNLLNIGEGVLVKDFRHPVQIFPVSMAPHPKGTQMYVLNKFSNTISTIDGGHLVQGPNYVPPGKVDLNLLAAYRQNIINAYLDLLGGLLQYLKDCFCDHLLVDCPECTGEEKIYLACISIRNREVYKVCNFSKRKYVKSFPTVEYWMSIVPIMPMISKAVERLCCLILPDFFAKQSAPEPSRTAVFSGRQVGTAARVYQKTDFGSITRKVGSSASLLGGITGDWAAASTARTTPKSIAQNDIAGQRTAEAKRQLEEKSVIVEGVQQYDPTMGAKNLKSFTGATGRIMSGERVILYEENGVVRYVAPAPVGTEAVEELRIEFDRTREQVKATEGLRDEISVVKADLKKTEGLREELNSVKADVQETVKVRQEFATVQSDVASLRKGQEDVTALKAQVGELQKETQETVKVREEFATVQSDVASLRKGQEDVVTLKAQVTALQKENSDLRKLSDSRATEITQLQSGISDLQKTLKSTRETDVAELQKQLKTLLDADAQRTKELTALREDVKTLQRRPG